MDQLIKFINNLNTAQRAVIIGGFSILFMLLIGLLIYSNLKAQDEKLNYTIASDLTKDQVMLASNELENAGVPFSIVGTGNNLTLKTNKEFINIAKIKLVTSEAATTKHVGWELFENSSLGTTNFENKVKYLRALEGELSRSLESLSGVLRANVKIAIPKDTIFTERKADTTASAVLSLKPGIYLTQKQIDGIKNFIASAIPELLSENIKLIDQDGTILEQTREDNDNQRFTTQNKYKEKMEKDFEKKIVSLLEPVVGTNRVVARVSVELDFTKQDIQQEIYEPEGTIRSQQTTESTTTSQQTNPNASGVPGVQSNIEDPEGANGDLKAQAASEESKNITNYEISKRIISQRDNGYASLKKLSAAVTFDSSILEDVDNREELITSMQTLVQDAVGFVPDRGDKITVRSFKFVTSTAGVSGTSNQDGGVGNVEGTSQNSVDTFTMVRTLLKDFGEYFQYVIAAILLFIFYRKFIANNEVLITPGGATAGSSGAGGNDNEDDPFFSPDYGSEFDMGNAHGRLKAKVKSQILNNIEGLDEESAAKYEVLIEELDKTVSNNPGEMAEMIELLLAEGNTKLRGKKK